MNQTLVNLIDSLKATLKILKFELADELQETLHSDIKLPGKRMATLACTAIDLLHETEQILEPGSLVLADHFLGIFLYKDAPVRDVTVGIRI